MIWTHGVFVLDDDRNRLDMGQISNWIRNAYWAIGRSHERVLESWSASAVVFGLYCNGTPVGCARVLTDFVTTAYLADVFIDSEYRGQGAGSWMMECIVSHPALENVRWLLHTRDAHQLYRKVGFEHAGERVMERPKRKES